jgi:hypothetical protein
MGRYRAFLSAVEEERFRGPADGARPQPAPRRQVLPAALSMSAPTDSGAVGGQLLAEAHGGSVIPSSTPEIGWADVDSDDEALVPSGPWFQWHCDRWGLPRDAHEMARNVAASQAFALRRNLAVQFHPELTSRMLAGWLGNGGSDKAASAGLDPEKLLTETRRQEEAARVRAHRLVDGFLRATFDTRKHRPMAVEETS